MLLLLVGASGLAVAGVRGDRATRAGSCAGALCGCLCGEALACLGGFGLLGADGVDASGDLGGAVDCLAELVGGEVVALEVRDQAGADGLEGCEARGGDVGGEVRLHGWMLLRVRGGSCPAGCGGTLQRCASWCSVRVAVVRGPGLSAARGGSGVTVAA
ncbi:hypothetical protein D3C74_298230 [compost metagenome]